MGFVCLLFICFLALRMFMAGLFTSLREALRPCLQEPWQRKKEPMESNTLFILFLIVLILLQNLVYAKCQEY